MEKQDAVLMGPFVGEFYWECGRFAPMLPYLKKKKYKKRNIKYVVLTREERFDLYGCYADVLIPLRIEGDYGKLKPNCFRLNGLDNKKYESIADKFRKKYESKYNIIEHLYPKIAKKTFMNKNQFHSSNMIFDFKPRKENFELVDNYLPDDKPVVVLAPRYRKGFQRNWNQWQKFYDRLSDQVDLMTKFNFIVCGKVGEYQPDHKNRFFDMNEIKLGQSSSSSGLLLAILRRSFFTFGSQSAIPNISLLCGVEVLEFGNQKHLHTVTYNIKRTPVTFIVDTKFNIDPNEILNKLKKILNKKYKKEIQQNVKHQQPMGQREPIACISPS
jgi:hypothetical protein